MCSHSLRIVRRFQQLYMRLTLSFIVSIHVSACGSSDTSFTKTSAKKIDFAVLSDLNGSYGSTSYNAYVSNSIRYLTENPPDVLLITGDMVAGQKAGLNYQAMWNKFHQTVTQPLIAKNIPVFVTPGNHDASAYPGFLQERQLYRDTWTLNKPENGYFVDQSDYPFNYAVQVDETLIISIDVTRNPEERRLPNAQILWLSNLLKEHAEIKNKIIFSHFPLYPFAQDRETDYIGDMRLLKLLERYEVDLHLSGHHHAYFPGTLDKILLASVGCIGSGQRKLIGDSLTSPPSFVRFSVEGGKVTNFRAHLGAEPYTVINHGTLPEKITHKNFVIHRIP